MIHRVAQKAWRRWEDIADVFAGPDDAAWTDDGNLIDQSAINPWDRGE